MDGIKENIKELAESLRCCAELRADSLKLTAVELLTKMSALLLTFLVLSLPLFFAVLFLLVAITLLLVKVVGIVWSFFIMSAALLLFSVILYLLCRPLFSKVMLRTFCRMFFKKENNDEK